MTPFTSDQITWIAEQIAEANNHKATLSPGLAALYGRLAERLPHVSEPGAFDSGAFRVAASNRRHTL